MGLLSHHRYCSVLLSIAITFIFNGTSISATTFTFVNKCNYTVWPGSVAGARSAKFGSTGFQLSPGGSRAFQAPSGWSGRFWGRTACNFDGSGHWSCATGDCGSGQVECNGSSAALATLAEFTLAGGDGQDYYDVSLVDGYNLPMTVQAAGGSGGCATTGCLADLNSRCPALLRVDGGGACKSACVAFGRPEYCCSGAYNSAAACKPSDYSQVFKSACPKAYSYAYDDPTSTFTCSGADYTITFCPSSPSQKSSMGSSSIGSGSGSVSGSGSGSGMAGQVGSADESWFADMATGSSIRRNPSSVIQLALQLISFSTPILFFKRW